MKLIIIIMEHKYVYTYQSATPTIIIVPDTNSLH